MHEAAAAVAGGSLRAMDAILRGDVEHAFHPGGGLHHAMPSRAAGFCIYNDVALAVARARAAGLRVMYIDLDVHHGDGVEAIHAADPGVLTVSIHESGRYLFPGTGFAWEHGEGEAAGTVVNVPLEPGTSDLTWLNAVSTLLPELAAAFVPEIIVSQHGCDTHATDPLAHLDVTTTSMGRAARLVDRLAHESTGGRWLATGGGGYGVYRVVPRAWAHVWLAGAHRDPGCHATRVAGSLGDGGGAVRRPVLPETFDDPPNAGLPMTPSQEAADARAGVGRRHGSPRRSRRSWRRSLAERRALRRSRKSQGRSRGDGTCRVTPWAPRVPPGRSCSSAALPGPARRRSAIRWPVAWASRSSRSTTSWRRSWP